MIEGAALYLPVNNVPFKKMFPEGRSDGGFFRKPTWYEYPTEQVTVRLNVKRIANDPAHLQGLTGYVSQLENTDQQKQRVYDLIDKVQIVLGASFPRPVEADSDAFLSLTHIAEVLDGFVFVASSIYLPDEGFIAGPMSYPEAVTQPLASVELSDEDIEARGETPLHLVAMRDQNMAALKERGFECADWLPVKRSVALRPIEEILLRYCALAMLFVYVSDTGNQFDSDEIHDFVERNDLMAMLSVEEFDIFAKEREMAHAEHCETIGWKLENMWGLAWVLGFHREPPFYVGQIPSDVIRELIDFLPDLEGNLIDVIPEMSTRSEKEVTEMEDLFYCAHNAVVDAQLGRPKVPRDFHPVVDGGAIHERRHALTWCLSPGREWDETDLST